MCYCEALPVSSLAGAQSSPCVYLQTRDPISAAVGVGMGAGPEAAQNACLFMGGQTCYLSWPFPGPNAEGGLCPHLWSSVR